MLNTKFPSYVLLTLNDLKQTFRHHRLTLVDTSGNIRHVHKKTDCLFFTITLEVKYITFNTDAN